MNIEIIKPSGSHPYNVVVDGIVWATVHRESRSRYGMRYWFQRASRIGGAMRDAKGIVYVWSTNRRRYEEDSSPKTLVVRLAAAAELLIIEGFLLSPEAEKAKIDTDHLRYQEACLRAEKARMQKLETRAFNFLSRFSLSQPQQGMVEALAQEFVDVIDAAI